MEAYLCISIWFSIILVSLVCFSSLTIIFLLYTAMAGVPYLAEEEDEKKEGLGVSGCWVAVAFRYLPHGISVYRGGKMIWVTQKKWRVEGGHKKLRFSLMFCVIT